MTLELVRNGDRPEDRMRALAKKDPAGALALVSANSGIALRKRADLADEFIGEIGDDTKANEFITAHLTEADQAELLIARQDLPAALVLVVNAKIVIDAIRRDIGALELTEAWYAIAFLLRSWALKLKDRTDWEDLLEEEILDGTPLRNHLLLAAALEIGFFDLEASAKESDPDADPEDENIADDDETKHRHSALFAECTRLGLDVGDTEKAIQDLLESGLPLDFTESDIASARAAVTQHAATRPERADQTATKVAEEIKI